MAGRSDADCSLVVAKLDGGFVVLGVVVGHCLCSPATAHLLAKASSVIHCSSLSELAFATLAFATPWPAMVMPAAPLLLPNFVATSSYLALLSGTASEAIPAVASLLVDAEEDHHPLHLVAFSWGPLSVLGLLPWSPTCPLRLWVGHPTLGPYSVRCILVAGL